MDNIGAVRVFLEIVRLGSFAEASRHIGLAASSVTRQINGLEAELGVRLLNRTTRQVSLTDAGRLYHSRARQAVLNIDDMNRAVTDLDSTPKGLLKISAPQAIGRVHIARHLTAFFERYPEIKLELSLTGRTVDLVQEGMDGAVRIAALQLPDSTLIGRKLHRVKQVICASPEYLEKHGTPVHPKELHEHECLVYYAESASEVWGPASKTWRFKVAGEDTSLTIAGKLETDSGDVVLEAVLNGLGITALPLWHVAEHLRSGRLVTLFDHAEISFDTVEANIFFVYPSARHLSPKIRAFSDFMAESFKALSL
ncbi:MAG: LysR family transcriptional regulator [Sneathiella sp.]